MITETRTYVINKDDITRLLKAYIKNRFNVEPTIVEYDIVSRDYSYTLRNAKVTCDFSHELGPPQAVQEGMKQAAERIINVGPL